MKGAKIEPSAKTIRSPKRNKIISIGAKINFLLDFK
jgi:hypothetical protein